MQALDMERSCVRSSHATLSAVGTRENIGVRKLLVLSMKFSSSAGIRSNDTKS